MMDNDIPRRMEFRTPEEIEAWQDGYDFAWEKIFSSFYDDNENGGSSRWLVSPDTVKQFIKGLLQKI